MNTDELDFHLPSHLIAQAPAQPRSASRLLHYRQADHLVAHHTFAELPDLLQDGDLLVFNDTRVLPARFALRKRTGGLVEGLFLAEIAPGRWRVLLRDPGNVSVPLELVGAEVIQAVIGQDLENGEWSLELTSDEPAAALLARVGRMPLPPYIKRQRFGDPRDNADREQYQTVLATHAGSVAAPTAGLHFTPELLATLDSRGIERANITLHVGLGTFRPVSATRLDDHLMHAETYQISARAAEQINRAEKARRRLVAVGTTVARVLESQPADEWIVAHDGTTAIFIRPPYDWKRVDALVTNFHLPRSTLVALVAAKVGLEWQRRLYSIAIAQSYRFFSYGDAMLLE